MTHTMKNLLLTSLAVMLLAGTANAQMPQLQKVGTSTCLTVNGQPFVLYCGELHNSTASSIDYMEQNRVWDNLKRMNLNSVIATASWELTEPEEGRFDFTLVDYIIREARERDMKVVLLWFGTWKNPFMTYAPSWVKHNPKRFPHAVDEQGNEMEMLSVYDDNILHADTRAYLELLRHIKDVDTDHTIVMIQLQNEPGLRGSKRDYSAAAERAWRADVPASVTGYLKSNKGSLQPDLEKLWAANGNKTTGNWETIFGKSEDNNRADDPIPNATEHLFTAYGYATYLGKMASAGKEVYPLPVFTNASVFGMNTRGRSLGNGCSIPEFFDIYRACAPSLDILTPNSYMQQLDWICNAFSWRGNPVLIPESTLIGARALYAIGEHDAIAFSPFGIDANAEEQTPQRAKDEDILAQCYAAMQGMGSLITSNIGTDRMRGIYLYSGHETDTISMGDYQLRFSPRKSFDIGALMAPANGGDGAQREPEKIEQGGALVVQTADDEFYIVGYGFNADISVRPGLKSRFCGYDNIYEGTFVNGTFRTGRLLNGDERNVYAGYDSVKALRVKMYRY